MVLSYDVMQCIVLSYDVMQCIVSSYVSYVVVMYYGMFQNESGFLSVWLSASVFINLAMA